MNNFMKAMLIRTYGGPEVFEFGDVETPVPGDEDILIKVYGSSVNPVDAGIRKGVLKSFNPLKMPAVLGVDVSGRVIKLGKSVKDFQVGDQVYAFTGINRNGGYGEFSVIPASFASKTPQHLSLVEAAVVPGVGMTVWEAFSHWAPLKQGSKVLINGATGGVGTFAIAIAKSLGAKVTAVCSTEKIELAKKLGAETVIDYKKEDLSKTQERFDVILNCVRETSAFRLKKLLSPSGKIVSIAGNPAEMPLVGISNFFSKKKIIFFFVKTSGKTLEALTRWMEKTNFKPIIERTFSWKDLASAHRLSETGGIKGKIGIQVE